MQPVVFQTLPGVFSFFTVVLLMEICALLLITGRRFLKQTTFVAVGVAGAVIGEGVSLVVYPTAAWLAILGGLAGGLLLCYRLRPAAMGVALAFLAYYGSTYLVSLEYVQYVAALVLFAYGLLLTDLAPTFVSSMLASAILLLSGIWLGFPVPLLVTLVGLAAAARILLTVLPHKLIGKSHPISGSPQLQ